MQSCKRKVTFRLYPSKNQTHKMEEILRLHQKLYNASLEQRIDAYKKRGVSLTYYDQAKELTLLRSEFLEYKTLNAQSEQVTLKRLDLAYKAFFQRVKKSPGKAGFPRFKSLDRFKSWGYASHGDGWKISFKNNFINGTLKLSGIGSLQARGRARYQDKNKTSRNPGTPKTLEVIRKSGKWYASVTFETELPYRESGTEALGIDWGIDKFLTIVNEQKKIVTIKNPRHLKKVEDKLKKFQKVLSKKKKGSNNRKKAKIKLIRIHEKLANKREDFLHQVSSKLVKRSKLIATEELNIKAMTVSGGKYKRGLNKSVLDTSPGKLLQLLKYKAEEAGSEYKEIPTRKLKPSQTCSQCGDQKKKELSERVHSCERCGAKLDRDVNASLVILGYALMGREPALIVEGDSYLPMKQETPSIIVQAV